MLTIQPNISSSYAKNPSFGYGSGMFDDAEYVDYEEIFDDPRKASVKSSHFDIDKEREKAGRELDLWEETKQNIDSIARTTESVPVLNNGMKIFSSLISIAVGWGGLRWGTYGTLKVMSDIAKTAPAKCVKNLSKDFYTSASNLFQKGKTFMEKQSWVVSMKNKAANLKKDFLESSVGTKYTSIKDTVKNSSIYRRSLNGIDDAVDYMKKINPKRIFVETMGVAGGGTAAINTLGAQTIDGNRHDIRQINDDVYIVDGRYGLDYRRNRGSRYGD